MAMNDLSFTSNEEIDAFQPGDNTIDIIGYVDCVEGSKLVGNNKVLFKFIINNNDGRRLRVLMWENNAKAFESRVINREIVRIQRGLYVPVNSAYFRREENLVPFEISFTKNSSIEFLGKHDITSNTESEVVHTSIKNCAAFAGKISVDGHIKVTFEQCTTAFSTYGSGSVVDESYKIRIHINNFRTNPLLIEGAHVRVYGEIKKDKYDSIYLHVNDVDDIKIIDDTIASHEQLRKGIHTPRKRSEDLHQDAPNAKRRDLSKDLSDDFSNSGLFQQLSFQSGEN